MVAYCRLGHSLPEESAARKSRDNYSPLPISTELTADISTCQIELRLQELSRYTRKLRAVVGIYLFIIYFIWFDAIKARQQIQQIQGSP